MFLQNRYRRIYDAICARAQARTVPACYVEKHHILPKCLGGSNAKSNIVTLTAKEHYVANLCLVKYTEGHIQFKMLYAVIRFGRRPEVNGRLFAHMREAFSEFMRGTSFTKGHKLTPEHRKKISDSLIGNTRTFGHKQTEESNQRRSETLKGRPKPESMKRKTSEWQTGRHLSPEHRSNIGSTRIGKPNPRSGWNHTPETIEKMREARRQAAALRALLTPEQRAEQKLERLRKRVDKMKRQLAAQEKAS